MKKLLRNRITALRAYNKGSVVTESKPVEIAIEITSFCNLACPMCGRSGKTTPNTFMSMELFCSIIDQVKDFAELVFISAGVGEPVAHPKLSQMIRYCSNSGLRSLVSTNGTLLNSEKADQLLNDSPDILVFSLDGATKQTHESIRVGSDFEATMGNVRHFCSEKNKRGLARPYTICQMIYMPENQGEADAFTNIWSRIQGVNSVRIKKLNYVVDSKMDAPKNNTKHEKLSCLYPWRQLVISATGDVGLCCRDHNFSYKVGNVKDTSIDQLWNSRPLQKARECLSSCNKGKLRICRDCEGVQPGLLTGFAVQFLDAYTIHKWAPVVERTAQKMGLKVW